MEIEVEREYSTLPREVLLTIDGEQQVATFEAAMLEKDGKYGNRVPMEFFISIKVQKENRWSVMAHNELVLQMVQMGVIPPRQSVELLLFEGKETLLKKSAQGQAMDPAMQQQVMMMEQLQQLPTPDAVM